LVGKALTIIDSEGVDALSIRRLAAEFNVAPNSIYSYVASKNDLLRGVFGLVIGKLDPPVLSGNHWTERARRACGWCRQRLLEHPNVVAASGFREVFPTISVPLIYSLGALLRDAEYEERELVDTMYVLLYHTIGFVALEVARETYGLPTQDMDEVLQQTLMDVGDEYADESPRLIRYAVDLDLNAVFDQSLDALLTGLEAVRTESLKS
jgi:AcrR family transcriptional regulator